MASKRNRTSAFQLLCGVSAVALVGLTAGSAQADCVQNGNAVVCDVSGGGFNDSDFDNGSVTVEDGVEIVEDDEGIRVGENVTVLNDGSVTSEDNDGIRVKDGSTVTNNGSVDAHDHGIEAFEEADVTVVNNGSIEAGKDGIRIGEGGTVTIGEGGSIVAGKTGIDAEDDDEDLLEDITVDNAGSITAQDGHGVRVGDGSVVTNMATGVIEATKVGINVDDDATVINDGTVTSTGDHAIQGDNGVTVTNNGSLYGEQDGVNVDDEGFVVNNGHIEAGDDGIQVEIDSIVVNNGSIEADAEGVNANADGATVTNNGSILSVDDGINAARNAYIVNNGTITVTGDQDGIDLDDGTVINTGTIMALGSEDGIDFDFDGAASSTVTNTGHIEGYHGIYVDNDPDDGDGIDGQGQAITNYGTIIGRSGTAIFLGSGDDTLQVGTGSLIDGDIDLGEGEADTFEIIGPVAGVYSFVTAPDKVQLNGFNAIVIEGVPAVNPQGPVVYAPSNALTIIAVDSSPFVAIDASVSEFGMDLSQTIATVPSAGDMLWARAFGGWSDFESTAMNQGFDLTGGGLVAGRDWDHGGQTFGLFGGVAVYGASLDDGIHDTQFVAGFAGLRAGRAISPELSLNADIWLGGAEARVDSSQLASGDGSATGLIAGIDGGFVFAPTGIPFLLEGTAGYNGFFGDTMDLNGLGVAVSGVASHHFHASLEAGAPFAFGRATVTPFLRLEADASTDSGLTASYMAQSVDLAADDLTTGAGIFAGLKINQVSEGGSTFDARVAVGTDSNGTLTADGRLGLKIPF
ncbi:autotransporter domain-containing protein [Oricola sp.]|uniref:beta strand repeat-containing protein n=1 Tax=Oricola sp. TaxID=1979950 RepID=UPI0025F7C440|nr:autotransporter domain-containing protein [Oricola sp.]MCI5073434.1 autotransporter domain-containing protein [Oricola sp.]